jgi:hypothetical protein
MKEFWLREHARWWPKKLLDNGTTTIIEDVIIQYQKGKFL